MYFNRFVSSAAKDLDPELFDENTGAITNPDIVAQLACSQNVCESGLLARGVGLSYQRVPGHEGTNQSYRTRRFVSGEKMLNQNLPNLFNTGMKWNDDVYCVPVELQQAVQDAGEGINVIFIGC